MTIPFHSNRRKLFKALLFSFCLFVPLTTVAQEQTDEVIRISSDLVQTDVMVFDRQGKFVDGLKPEQFELRVDGKPQTISFFERVQAGSSNEDAQIAAARGVARPPSQPGQALARPLDRGRIIFFYLDDLHMGVESVTRTREALMLFVEKEMGQNDQVAIITSSGQLGILQQLTGEKHVLLMALKRFNPRNNDVTDTGRTPMTEHQALSILRNDRAVIDYFVEQLSKELNMRLTARGARTTQPIKTTAAPVSTEARLEQLVVARAKTIIEQANILSQNTLTGLENLVRSVAPIPGRKLLFFISDGFFINEQSSQANQKLPQIADAAARSGTVIYSMEAHGLVSGLTPASEKMAYDPTARVSVIDTAAVTESQQPLHQLAMDTGGRALLDTNAFAPGLAQALNETSVYYLLAWRPIDIEQKADKFHRIEASIKGRDDLIVRVRGGFLSEPPDASSKRDSSKAKSAKQKAQDSDLLTAIHSLYPKRSLPTALSVGYTNTTDAGLMLTASVQVDGSVLTLNAPEGALKSNVDVVGVLINDQGKTVSEFEQRLTIDPTRMTKAQQQRLVYSQQMRITPGLYQVRVAARDNKTARTGSAIQWIEIPDITQGSFSLGSLFVGEMIAEAGSSAAAPQQALISVNRRFSRTSRLLFQTYVYNAARGTNAPDVALQVQVFRDDQPIITVPLRKLPTNGIADLTRISYEDDFALDQLPVGSYVLQVTAIDRVAKASTSQRLNFEIQ